MSSQHGIPDEIMGAAYHKVRTQFGEDADYWYTEEGRAFKEALGPDHAHKDEKKLIRWAINFRKAHKYDEWCRLNGITVKDRGGRVKHETVISPELADHYQSGYYNQVKDACRRRDERCRICDDPIESFHHRRYDRIKTPSEIDDIISVCNDCHEMCDKQRKKAAARRSNNRNGNHANCAE